jgi:hypothetical protein
VKAGRIFFQELQNCIYLKNETIYRELADILRIANTAFGKAKEENRENHIPEVFWIGGKFYYLLLTGEITSIRPKILEKGRHRT